MLTPLLEKKHGKKRIRRGRQTFGKPAAFEIPQERKVDRRAKGKERSTCYREKERKGKRKRKSKSDHKRHFNSSSILLKQKDKKEPRFPSIKSTNALSHHFVSMHPLNQSEKEQ